MRLQMGDEGGDLRMLGGDERAVGGLEEFRALEQVAAIGFAGERTQTFFHTQIGEVAFDQFEIAIGFDGDAPLG